jgi:hypothetical protein
MLGSGRRNHQTAARRVFAIAARAAYSDVRRLALTALTLNSESMNGFVNYSGSVILKGARYICEVDGAAERNAYVAQRWVENFCS